VTQSHAGPAGGRVGWGGWGVGAEGVGWGLVVVESVLSKEGVLVEGHCA